MHFKYQTVLHKYQLKYFLISYGSGTWLRITFFFFVCQSPHSIVRSFDPQQVHIKKHLYVWSLYEKLCFVAYFFKMKINFRKFCLNSGFWFLGSLLRMWQYNLLTNRNSHCNLHWYLQNWRHPRRRQKNWTTSACQCWPFALYLLRLLKLVIEKFKFKFPDNY